jgi:two-component system sensor histidine kinase HydH
MRTHFAAGKGMMKKRSKKMYIPALSIAATILLLLLFIGVSTYRNFNRDRSAMRSFLDRQGSALFKSIEAAVEMNNSSLGDAPGISKLIRKISEIDDVAYIYISGSSGGIIYQNGTVPEDSAAGFQDFKGSPEIIIKKTLRSAEGLSIYQMSKFYSRTGLISGEKTGNLPDDSGRIVTLGLIMTNYESSLRADMHHAMVMAAILIVLGSGLIFFLFVIQNYYLVDKSLKETQDYTRQVIANMANGLISIDNDGKVVSYNKQALELLEIREEQAEGIELSGIIDFKSSGIADILHNKVSSLEKEISLDKKSGEGLPLSLSVAPIFMESGQVNGAVIILRDLREIKRLEEKVRRSEKLAAIGRLAAGVAHEIRNPLSSIKGFAQFLRHVLKDRPEEREYANVMVHEIDRINRVVSDLLIYSKPFEVKRTDQNLNELIDHTILLVQADAKDRQIAIIKNIPEENYDLWLDPNQITHALLNLLLKSLEAVSDGGRIEVGYELSGKKQVSIWVEDDGCGIQDGYREKVMDPFYTTRDKGTGLGLAIVHKIVENHNGEIRIDSPPLRKPNGTRITLTIPLSVNGEEKAEK